VREHDLIAELREIVGAPQDILSGGGVRVGIGDDCALLSLPEGVDLLVTTDSQREGVHFRRDWFDPVAIGRRLVTVNVSDVASKGGSPAWAVVAAGLPAGMDPEFLKGVYRGISEASRRYGITIVGGDISRDPGGLSLVMTLMGTTPRGTFVGRGGLSPGDAVYLLGRPGRSRAGYLSLAKKIATSPLETAREAFREPRALLGEGKLLVRRPEVCAMTDTSDGLERSLTEMGRASGVAIVVEEIPVSAEIELWASFLGENPGDLVWQGGEDYDLVVGVSEREEKVFVSWAREELLRDSPEGLFRIGHAVSEKEAVLNFAKGLERLADGRGGFEHTI
jgi:thiamine-monophosphate kinase